MNPKGTKWVISLNKWTQKVQWFISFYKVQSELSPLTNEPNRYKVIYLPYNKWIQKVQSELSPFANEPKRYKVIYLP